MPEPLAYLDGQLLPASAAAVPVTDAGFVTGTTVAEQMRTFDGKLFRLGQHLDRLQRSLDLVGVQIDMKPSDLALIAQRLVDNNHALLAEGDDLGISVFVTPGTYPTFSTGDPPRPLVGMHTYLLPFYSWSRLYEQGQSLIVSNVRQVPANCWSPELKCRSRMHYFLADREAREKEPGSRALLLDQSGHVLEASTASVVIYIAGEGLVAPPKEEILAGISLTVVEELARQLELPFTHRQLLPSGIAGADEVILCSTSPCLLPVTRLDGKPIGSGTPGPIFQRCLTAWSDMAGIDLRKQALQFSDRQ